MSSIPTQGAGSRFPPGALDPVAQRLDTFRSWMTHHRGLRASTLDVYCRIVGALLLALGLDGTRYEGVAIRRFVLESVAGYSTPWAHTVATAVRAFLRYLAAVGECAAALVDAVPIIAGWCQATLPRYVSAADAERIVAAPDRRTRVGKRDYAILLLLSRLGLRANDVAGLRLSDVDWNDGSFLVAGKARRQDRLPLPQDVGDAILAYLQKGRPPTDDDHVFIRAVRPFAALTSIAVGLVVRRAILRVGVKAPSHGAHLLRHSLATQMLRQGASLQAIGQVLRHRSIGTTAHYAKVDIRLLQEVAQPWPEVTPW